MIKLLSLGQVRLGLPDVPCPEGCAECCGDSVFMTYMEWQMIPTHLRPGIKDMRPHPCVFLRYGRCAIYAYRPSVCRLYGTTAEGHPLTCQVGIAPDVPLVSAEIFRRVDDLSLRLYLDILETRRLTSPPSQNAIAWTHYLSSLPAIDQIMKQVRQLEQAASKG